MDNFLGKLLEMQLPSPKIEEAKGGFHLSSINKELVKHKLFYSLMF